MITSTLFRRVPLALAAASLVATAAQATTRVVAFDALTESATLATVFHAGDTLRLNSFVADETGPLQQTIQFTVGADVGSFDGHAAWEVSAALGAGPRLIGVNIDVLDAGNSLVVSDTIASPLVASFAHSTMAGLLTPGIYTLKATGTGVRESSLDLTLTFAAAVPEPQTWALMLAGAAALGLLSARRRA